MKLINYCMSRSFTFAFSSILLVLALFVAGCKSAEPLGEDSRSPNYVVPPLFDPSDPAMQVPQTTTFSSDLDVDSLLSSMSLHDKIAQLFVVPAYGSFTNENEPRYLRLKRLVAEQNVGGIIFMHRDIYGQAMMTNELQSLAKIPLWITQDMEFGAAMRVRGTTRFTPAMGIAATQNPDNAYQKGVITAREAKALGVHQVFAPVLDVNNNPDNPVINVRSYGGVPEIVAEFGNYFIRGIESEGILATAKHFPGHGDTDTDSHLALPTIVHDFERIQNLELVPFKVNIESGLQSIMSAHIAYPNISENIGRPSTLDESVLNRILIDSLKFNGLVVTDGLVMQGITDHYAPGEAVVLALKAGADLMLISPNELTAIQGVKDAVEIGRISEQRIDESVRKLLNLKKNRGVFENHAIDLQSLNRDINTRNYQAIANSIARQSLTVLSNENDIIPISDAKYPSVLVVTVADDSDGDTGINLAREMRKYHQRVVYHNIDQRTTEEEKTE